MTWLRIRWIVASVALVLGGAAFLYLAHLGEGSHAGECEVCDLAANGSAVEPGIQTAETSTVLLGLAPAFDTDELLTTTHSTAAPRAPPIS